MEMTATPAAAIPLQILDPPASPGAGAPSGGRSRLPTVSVALFRRACLLALALLGAIVVTGGAVRLTGSGLGCPTWPRCTDSSFVAQPQYAAHGLIEFGNRVVSLAVGLVVLALPVLSLRLAGGRRRDLTLLGFGLWLGFLAQAVLGGLTVLFDLAPPWVMAHFLVSMLLLLDAAVLHWRAGLPVGRTQPVVAPEVRWLALLTASVAALALVIGTVVTGAGPHSGGSLHSPRLPVDVRAVSWLHADVAVFLTGLVLATCFAVRLAKAPLPLRRLAVGLLAVIAAQAGLGFTQYALGVPTGLVAAHIAGATLLWVLALRLVLLTRGPISSPASADGR